MVQTPAELAEHPRYRPIRLLGEGGMGAVWLAEHRLMERQVAIKVINQTILDQPQAISRFLEEIKAAAKLDHANIVRAFDAEQAGNFHLLVMEYVDGIPLHQVIEKKGPLPVAIAVNYIRQAALGLQHAHEKGMVHRDIKPQNLIMSKNGTIKLLDFGLAKMISERNRVNELTEVNNMLGTPDYLAPEQAMDASKADIRADIYSLGCTLYTLLSTHPPFLGKSTMQIVMGHLQAPAPNIRNEREDVPSALADLLLQMMAKKPEDRPGTPKELAELLRPFEKLISDSGSIPKLINSPIKLDRQATIASSVTAGFGQATRLPQRLVIPPPPKSEKNKAVTEEKGTKKKSNAKGFPVAPVALAGLLLLGLILFMKSGSSEVDPTTIAKDDTTANLEPVKTAPTKSATTAPLVPPPSRTLSLEIGDAAPPLAFRTFLKGDPISQFESGKIYVLDFFYPEIASVGSSIPTMSRLQKKYPNITFVGVGVLERNDFRFRTQLESNGDRVSHRIAAEAFPPSDTSLVDNGRMNVTWLKAAGQKLPATFIVNGEGKIAWVGDLLDVETCLTNIIAKRWDLTDAAIKERKLQEIRGKLSSAERSGETKKIVELADASISIDPQSERSFTYKKLLALQKAKDWDQTVKVGERFADIMISSPELLNNLAWTFVTGSESKLKKLGLKLAEKADRTADQNDAATADTYAKALFETGDISKALEVQNRAMKLAKGTSFQFNAGLLDRLNQYFEASRPRRQFADIPSDATFTDIRGVTVNELHQWLAKLPKGMRPTAINARSGVPYLLFDAVAEYDPSGADWKLLSRTTKEESSLILSDYKSLADEGGYRLAIVCVLPIGDIRLYVKDRLACVYWFGSENFVMEKSTFCRRYSDTPIIFGSSVKDIRGNQRFESYYHVGAYHPCQEWEMHTNISSKDLSSKMKEYRDKNWRPHLLSSVAGIDPPRYNVVFRENRLGYKWDFKENMSDEEFRRERYIRKEDSRPLVITSHMDNAKPLYNVVWMTAPAVFQQMVDDVKARRACEAILAIGGRIEIEMNSRIYSVVSKQPLPKSGFAIQNVCVENNGTIKSATEVFGTLPIVTNGLYLPNGAVSDAGINKLVTFPGLANLRMIDLSSNPITDGSLTQLRKLEKLEIINIQGSRVSSSGLENLKGLKVKILYLNNCKGINDDAADKLIEFKELTDLMLTGTKMTPKGINKIKSALPGCKVISDAK
jgi:serine/threonine protein kinase/tetratricopeptide (TPR) repeat protein